MYGSIFTLLTALFLAFYGACLLGWPLDVTRGVGFWEKRSPRTRQVIGFVLVAGGLLAAGCQLFLTWK